MSFVSKAPQRTLRCDVWWISPLDAFETHSRFPHTSVLDLGLSFPGGRFFFNIRRRTAVAHVAWTNIYANHTHTHSHSFYIVHELRNAYKIYVRNGTDCVFDILLYPRSEIYIARRHNSIIYEWLSECARFVRVTHIFYTHTTHTHTLASRTTANGDPAQIYILVTVDRLRRI